MFSISACFSADRGVAGMTHSGSDSGFSWVVTDSALVYKNSTNLQDTHCPLPDSPLDFSNCLDLTPLRFGSKLCIIK